MVFHHIHVQLSLYLEEDSRRPHADVWRLFPLGCYSVPWIPYASAPVNSYLCILYSAGLSCSAWVSHFHISGLESNPVRGWRHHGTSSVYFLSLRDHTSPCYVAQSFIRVLSYILFIFIVAYVIGHLLCYSQENFVIFRIQGFPNCYSMYYIFLYCAKS